MKPEKTLGPLAALKRALKYGNRSTIFLRCMGEDDCRWDGVTRPSSMAWVPEIACGYPIGTHQKTTGANMFGRTVPKKGVYTFPKIIYDESLKRGQRYEKTGEKVYYRKVEESDVEAIKKAFPHLVF